VKAAGKATGDTYLSDRINRQFGDAMPPCGG